jgi:hypothetical protein
MFPNVRGNDVYKIPPAPPPDNVLHRHLHRQLSKLKHLMLLGIGLFILVDIDLKLLNPDVKVEYTLVLKIDPEYA